MAQIQKKFIAANAVDETKIRLTNNAFLRARNAADSGDISIFKVNASDRIEFASVPQSTSDATAGNDLVRFSQITSLIEGLTPKTAVRVATTTAGTLATSFENGDTIDGITLVTGDRILIKDQADPAENGIYTVNATGAPTRATDYDNVTEIPGSYTVAQEGTDGQGVLYVTTSTPAVLNTDPIVFVARAVQTYSGGDMITLTGSTFSVDLATTSGLESSNPGNVAGQLRIKLEASNPTLQIDGSNQLGVKLDGARAITTGASGIGLNVAAAGGLQISTNALQIKSDTVTANTIGVTTTSDGAGTKFDSNSFTDSGSETLALAAGVAGAGLALTTGVLSVNVDASTIEINTDTLRVKDAGITLGKLASDSVDENKIVSTTFSTTGALNGGSGTKVSVRTDGVTTKINGSNNLESLKANEEHPTLSGTDITNQFFDLAFAAYGTSAAVNSVSLNAIGGPIQLKGTDYTVSLTGGVGGVTRITFAGDLATGGAAELIAGDKLAISYSYLT